MDISKEQILKILELAGKTSDGDISNISNTDISRALIEIERKLNFFDVDVNFNSENKNVLIVDDLELSLYKLNQLMKKVGLRSFVARNVEEAKAEIIRHHFHFLLIDLFLPDSQDGISLIKDVIAMKNSGKQDYKIIVISASDDKDIIDNCYKLGVDGFVTKTDSWHTDILKYLKTPHEHSENNLFEKNEISKDTALYSLRRFNEKKIYDEIIADINSSILAGINNIVMNLEKVMIFDQDNTYIFAEIYKICQNAGGTFLLVNPSEKIKDALASAFLEGVIPVFSSLEYVKEYLGNLKNI
jgi:DNA-binding NarL/FixJ family response regulator